MQNPSINRFSFYVGDTAHRWTSEWIFKQKRGQIYLFCKSHGGFIKLSIHTPEICQFGDTDEFQKKYNKNKNYVRWKRTEAPDGKILPIAQLLFPTELLKARHELAESAENTSTFRIHPAPTDSCVEMFILYAKKPQDGHETTYNFAPHVHIATMELGEDQLVFIVARHTKTPSGFFPDISQMNPSSAAWSSEKLEKLPKGHSMENLHAQIWSTPSDGEVLRIGEISGLTLTRNSE